MSLFDYTSPSVAVHASVTSLFDSTAGALSATIPAGPDHDAAISSLVQAAEQAHLAIDKVPAVDSVPVVIPPPAASEGAAVDAGAAPVAGPPPAPEAPAPTPVPATVYVPAVTPDVIREVPGQPKPGT